MKFIQYYLDCLSHASYLIGDENSGRAVVVDPQRDVSEYLADAAELGLHIDLVIETHFHADFLSGHLELADATGATVVYSSVATPEFDYLGVEDGQRYSLDPAGVTLEFRHTPGHTPESMSVVVYEHPEDATPYGVLTGDTLFIGDVGRPDLLASIGYSREELAAMLYDSLHQKLMTLPDEIRVYPAHGAGSACGKNLSTELSSTIGDQKRWNYALNAPDRETFIALVTEGQPPAPGYFAYDATLNRKNRALLDEDEMPPALSYPQVMDRLAAGAVLVDGRSPIEFAQGHFRAAINIGLEGRYAEFAGSVVTPDNDIVLITDPGYELEGKNRLARIGFDRVIGHLENPEQAMLSHPDQVQIASRLSAKDFDQRAASVPGLQIVDVRNPGEAEAGTITGAVNIPVGQLPDRLAELDSHAPTVVYCAGGYRSSVAASMLRRNGFADVSDILGGFGAWVEITQNA
ncbi:MBL fold metallo-hydrolase [Mycolicibacterium obuense]|uniref:MBL fold metallo-hydrolase n=1 Tax=Mycolicibacterium obuense TaxID=1807 RepID=A0A0M2K252_9MYCO|nr:MBL fold metallo-hydrolase [Mycolicibacterium obuense]KKF01231.1 sulfurtransferase [Mycolicibacterium obuense]TDL08531.1 MBL fold metallo-hydrolase [Mycolicibacterium obuense]